MLIFLFFHKDLFFSSFYEQIIWIKLNIFDQKLHMHLDHFTRQHNQFLII